MSIRAFVTSCSLLLMVWLMLAFIHAPTTPAGTDPVTPEVQPVSADDVEEVGNLTVSVSP